MINVSEALYRAMQTNTNFKQAITITLADATVLNIAQSDIVVQGNSITTGARASGLPLGLAIGRMITIGLANFDDRFSDYDFYGAQIALDIYYDLDAAHTERISYGTYTVVTPETMGTTISITAMDNMYKADKEYTTSLTFPASALAVLLDACQTCGILLQTATFTNDDYVFQKKPEATTFRELFGGIASLMGGNAYINRLGKLELRKYDVSKSQALIENDGLFYKPWEDPIVLNGGTYDPWNTGDVEDSGTYTGDRRADCHILYAWTSNPAIDTDDITITGVCMEDEENARVLYGTDTYVLDVTNPIFAGDEANAVQCIGPEINGLKFRMFSGTYIGNPTIEFMDDAVIVDKKGNVYSTVITDITYNFRGTTELKNSAEPVIRNQTVYNGTTRTVQRMRQMMDRKLSAYDLGIQNLSAMMTQSVGFYFTEEIDGTTGAKIFYMHDQPLLADSTVIYKRTLTAYAQSTDGGATWNSGVDIMGNAVMNTVAAKGISADWITTGAIMVTDINDVVTFLADYATGAIHMNPSFLTVGPYNPSDPSPTTFQQYVDGRADSRMGQYLYYSAADGLVVSLTGTADGSSALPFNVQILNDRVNIRNRTTVLASYSAGGMVLNDPSGNIGLTAADGLNVHKGTIGGFSADDDGLTVTYAVSRFLDYNVEINRPKSGVTKILAVTKTEYEIDYDAIGDDPYLPGDEPLKVKTSEERIFITRDGRIHCSEFDIGDTTSSTSPHIKIWESSGYLHSRFALGSIFSTETYTNIYNLSVDSSAVPLVLDLSVPGSPSFGGRVYVKESSSKRYKDHVSDMPLEYARKVLGITPVIFRYKPGYLRDGDECEGKEIPGFYAEDVYDHVPMGAFHNGSGLLESWKPDRIVPLMLRVMQDQQETIDAQQKKIDGLEERLARLERMVMG